MRRGTTRRDASATSTSTKASTRLTTRAAARDAIRRRDGQDTTHARRTARATRRGRGASSNSGRRAKRSRSCPASSPPPSIGVPGIHGRRQWKYPCEITRRPKVGDDHDTRIEAVTLYSMYSIRIVEPLVEPHGPRDEVLPVRPPRIDHHDVIDEEARSVVALERELVGRRRRDVEPSLPAHAEVVDHPGRGAVASPVEVDLGVGSAKRDRAELGVAVVRADDAPVGALAIGREAEEPHHAGGGERRGEHQAAAAAHAPRRRRDEVEVRAHVEPEIGGPREQVIQSRGVGVGQPRERVLHARGERVDLSHLGCEVVGEHRAIAGVGLGGIEHAIERAVVRSERRLDMDERCQQQVKRTAEDRRRAGQAARTPPRDQPGVVVEAQALLEHAPRGASALVARRLTRGSRVAW